MATIVTPDTCTTIMQDTAIKIAVNDLFHLGPETAILLCKPLIIDLFKRFKMIFNTLIILRSLMVALDISNFWMPVCHPGPDPGPA